MRRYTQVIEERICTLGTRLRLRLSPSQAAARLRALWNGRTGGRPEPGNRDRHPLSRVFAEKPRT